MENRLLFFKLPINLRDLYLRENISIWDLERQLTKRFARHNTLRQHEGLGNRTPEKAYVEDRIEKRAVQAA